MQDIGSTATTDTAPSSLGSEGAEPCRIRGRMETTTLVCEGAGSGRGARCGAMLGVLPGRWVVVRRLQHGERSRPGKGSLVCRSCGRKWEVQQIERAAA